MIVIIFGCIVGLGYLGQTTNGGSLVKSNKETERYIPQKIRKYNRLIKNKNQIKAKKQFKISKNRKNIDK